MFINCYSGCSSHAELVKCIEQNALRTTSDECQKVPSKQQIIRQRQLRRLQDLVLAAACAQKCLPAVRQSCNKIVPATTIEISQH